MIPTEQESPRARQVIGDCLAIVTILALVAAAGVGVALHGLADGVNAFGDFMRAVLG